MRDQRAMRKYTVVLWAISSLGCTHIVFDSPQPREESSLLEFPEQYRGIFLPESDGLDTLIVARNTVTLVEFDERMLSLASIDTLKNITLKEGLLYDAELPIMHGVPYSIEDTVVRYHYFSRQVIGLSDTLIIKDLESQLVVSTNFVDDIDDHWDVVLVKSANTGDLIIYRIGNLNPSDNHDPSGNYDGQLQDFADITSIEKINENTFMFRPTKEQFLKLIKKDLFSQKETYKRIR